MLLEFTQQLWSFLLRTGFVQSWASESCSVSFLQGDSHPCLLVTLTLPLTLSQVFQRLSVIKTPLYQYPPDTLFLCSSAASGFGWYRDKALYGNSLPSSQTLVIHWALCCGMQGKEPWSTFGTAGHGEKVPPLDELDLVQCFSNH